MSLRNIVNDSSRCAIALKDSRSYFDEEDASIEIEPESDDTTGGHCDLGVDKSADSDSELCYSYPSYKKTTPSDLSFQVLATSDEQSTEDESADNNDDELPSRDITLAPSGDQSTLPQSPSSPLPLSTPLRIPKLGSRYQADIARATVVDDCNDTEGELVWDPSEALVSSPDDEQPAATLATTKAEDFMSQTQAPPSHDYDDLAHSLNFFDDDTPVDSKTKPILTTEEALSVLHQNKYNVPEALHQMNLKGQYWSSKKRPLEKWSNYEIECFERGMDNHYKLFGMIQSNEMAGTGKTVGDIVQYYYVWKKLPRASLWRKRREGRLREERLREEESDCEEKEEATARVAKRKREEECDIPIPCKRTKLEDYEEDSVVPDTNSDESPLLFDEGDLSKAKLNSQPFWDATPSCSSSYFPNQFSLDCDGNDSSAPSNIYRPESVPQYPIDQFTFFPPFTSTADDEHLFLLTDSFFNLDGPSSFNSTDKKPIESFLFTN